MSLIDIKTFRSEESLNLSWKRGQIADFLYNHLEQYGDKKEDILSCIDFAFNPHRGGIVFAAGKDGELVGVCIINFTGMSGFIPENILVYIAVDGSTRGLGIGSRILEKVILETEGNIALHVEPDNPAKKLYEKYGFTNKYLEMRLQK